MKINRGKPAAGDLDTGSTFAYYYPDDHPSVLIAFLGAGGQGAAILVRSLRDGKLYVRKRENTNVSQSSAGQPAANGSLNASQHPNICRLILQTRMQESKKKSASSHADLWQFCSGSSLGDFITSYLDRDQPIPEPVIWRLFREILSAVLHLHHHNISHSDIWADNVFIDWPTSTSSCLTSNPSPPSRRLTSIPPTFLLGDFGASFTLPPDACTKVDRGFDSTYKAVEHDFICLWRTIDAAMQTANTATTNVALFYSDLLIKTLKKLDQVPPLLQKYDTTHRDDANGEMYARVIDDLLSEVDRGIKQADTDSDAMDFSAVRPDHAFLDGAKPLTYHSREALLAKGCRPPGPWCVAEVRESRTGWRVVSLDLGKRYCEDEEMVTKRTGPSKVQGHGVGCQEDVEGSWEDVEGTEVVNEWPEACLGRQRL